MNLKKNRFLPMLFVAALLVSAASAQQQPDPPQSNLKVIEAVKLYNDGKMAEAAGALEAVIVEDPSNSEAYSWLGFVYLRMDQADKAVPVLQKAAEMRPNDYEVVINLGNAYLSTSNSDGALDCYRKAAEMKPGESVPWYNIGNICLQKKDYSGALEALQKAAALKNDDAYIWNNMGVAYEGLGQLDEAARAYLGAVRLSPDNGVFNRNAGSVLVKQGKTDEAQPYLEKAHAAGAKDASLCFALGEIYLRKDRISDAMAMFDECGPEMKNSADFWFNMGVARTKLGDAGAAEEAYRQALSLDSKHVGSLNNLGLLLYGQARYTEAAGAFKALYDLNTDNKGAQLNLAAAYANSNRLREAMVLWREFIKANPNRNDVRLDLAASQWMLGDHANARFHYATVLKSDPTNFRALNGIGLWHLERTELEKAEAAFRGSIRSNSTYVPAYNNLAIALERMNKMREAISVLERAAAIDPNAKEVQDNLARMKKRIS